MSKSEQQSSHLQQRPPFHQFLFKSFLWNHHISVPFQQICLIVSNLQFMAVLMWIQLKYITTDYHDNFSKTVKEVSRIVSIRELFDVDVEDNAALIVTMGIPIVYFIIFAALGGIIVYNFMNKTNISAKINIISAYFAQFHLTIGFWVISMILIDYLSAGLEDITQATTLQLIICIMYFLLIILNYIIGFVFAIYSYDPFITSNFLSSHTSSFQIFMFLSKAILAPIITSSSNSTSNAWALVALSFVTLGISYAYLLHAFPYYNYSAMKISIIFTAINFLIALVNFVSMIVSNYHRVPPTLLAYGLALAIPLLIKAVMRHLDIVIVKYLVLPNRSLKSKNEVYKKIFALTFVMDKANVTLNSKKDKNPYELRFWGALSQYDQERTRERKNEQLEKANDENIINQETRFTIREMCEYYTSSGEKIIKDLLQFAVSKFKKDHHFKVLLAQLSLKNNLPFLVASICLAETFKVRGHTKLAALNLSEYFQKRIDSYFHENTGKVLHLKNFIELEAVSGNFIKKIQSIAKKFNSFWTLYLKPQIRMKDFYLKSKDIEVEADEITHLWESFVDKNKMFGHSFCSVYSLYLSLIRACPHEAHKIMAKYYLHNLNEIYGFENNKPLSDQTLMSPYVISLYASMTREHPGVVLSHSSNLTELLGWTQIDVVGQGVELILPSFMGDTHQRILYNHIEKTFEGITGSRMYKKVEAFVLHKEGHMVPCEVYLSIHPYVQETPRYMVLVRVKKAEGDHLLVNRLGIIEGYTNKIGEVLGINSSRRVHISSLCENSMELEEVLNNPLIHGGREKASTGRLDLIWNKRFEDFSSANAAKTPIRLERKSVFESIFAMKRTFSANFFTNRTQLNTGIKTTESYTVTLAPQTFGDIFYFKVTLEHENPAEDAIRFYSSHVKTTQQEVSDTSANISSERSSDGENTSGLPEFQTAFSNQKFKKLATFSVTHQDTENSPGLVNTRVTDASQQIGNAYNRNLASTFGPLRSETLAGKVNAKCLDQSNAQSNPTIAFLQDPLSAGFSPGRIELASPVASNNPLVQLLSESSEIPKDNVKKGAKAKVVDIDTMASSSVGTQSKKYMNKLEQAIKIMPQNALVKILHVVLLLFVFLSGGPLIAFNFQNQATMELVESSIGAISKSIFRLVRITDIGQYVRNVWQARIGLYRSDRYAYLGWEQDAGDLLSSQIYDILTDLNAKNNALRAFVYKLDPDLQNEIYADKLPIYEMDSNGTIAVTRHGNTFDLITELVSQGRQMVDSGLPINEHNPFLLFVLNNTFNDLLVASQRTIPILLDDNETKMHSQSLYIYLVIALLSIGGVLILLFFYSIIHKFVKKRKHFINIFGLLNEKQIHTQLSQIQNFLSMLETTNSDSKKIMNKVNSEIFLQDLPSAKGKSTKQIKKNTSTKGINTKLIQLYCSGIFFLIMVFSVYLVLIAVVNSGNSSILTKMNLMAQSNLNLFNTNFLLTTIYEYIQENISTYVRNKPIKQEWEETFVEMTKVQDFLLLDILGVGNGLSDNPGLHQIVVGSLCTAVPTTDKNLANMCPIIGGGAVERGMVGLNSYTLASVKEVKEYFDGSAETWDNMFYALSFEGLINIEVFYPFTYNAYVWIDELIGSEIKQDFDEHTNSIIKIVAAYLIIYIMFGGIISKRIAGGLENEMNNWRKILRQIPHSVIAENKLLKTYIGRISDGILQN